MKRNGLFLLLVILLTGCVSASYTRSADEVTFKYRGVFKQIEDLEADVSSGSVDAGISFGSSGDTFDANEAIRDARDMVVTGVTGRIPEDEQ